MGLLAELKRGVPFFSGRYVGHMNGEQTIASQIGYLAAMLYNPNNVSIEASPVTTRLELEVAAELARMIGYDPATSWGHLASGGTVANFEALWIAVMDPFLAEPDAPDHIGGLIAALRRVADECIRDPGPQPHDSARLAAPPHAGELMV